VASVRPLDEVQLLQSLRKGDENAFAMLVDEHGAAMLRVARMYVRSDAVAEEVVQEAWLGALRGLERFEGRSSLRTWIFRILTNVAKTARHARAGLSPSPPSSRRGSSRARPFPPRASGRPATDGPLIGRAHRKTGPRRKTGFSRPRPGR
jgi:RNA polymerase sigma-70 factor, ECF subfamily